MGFRGMRWEVKGKFTSISEVVVFVVGRTILFGFKGLVGDFFELDHSVCGYMDVWLVGWCFSRLMMMFVSQA